MWPWRQRDVSGSALGRSLAKLRFPKLARFGLVFIVAIPGCAFLLVEFAKGMQAPYPMYMAFHRMALFHDVVFTHSLHVNVEASGLFESAPHCLIGADINPAAIDAGHCRLEWTLGGPPGLCRYSLTHRCLVLNLPMTLMERPAFMAALTRYLRDPCTLVDDVAQLRAVALRDEESGRVAPGRHSPLRPSAFLVQETRDIDRTFACGRGNPVPEVVTPLPQMLKLERHVIRFHDEKRQVVMRIVPVTR